MPSHLGSKQPRPYLGAGLSLPPCEQLRRVSRDSGSSGLRATRRDTQTRPKSDAADAFLQRSSHPPVLARTSAASPSGTSTQSPTLLAFQRLMTRARRILLGTITGQKRKNLGASWSPFQERNNLVWGSASPPCEMSGVSSPPVTDERYPNMIPYRALAFGPCSCLFDTGCAVTTLGSTVRSLTSRWVIRGVPTYVP